MSVMFIDGHHIVKIDGVYLTQSANTNEKKIHVIQGQYFS